MKMTFDQYIINPMGIKNSVFSNKELYRNLYTDKFNKLLVRETGRILYRLYFSENGKFYIYLKIPSEIVELFYYDTVIEFSTEDDHIKLENNLTNYDIKFYSNDPSFVFTFAHAMKSNDLFIKDFETKMSKQALDKVAVEKNPKSEIGYVKSLYFAYLTIKKYSLFNKVAFKAEGEKYNKGRVMDLITHSDIKIQQRIEGEQRLNKKKNVEKKKEGNRTTVKPNIQSNNSSLKDSFIKSTNFVKTVKKVGMVANTKRTKTI